VAQYVRPTIPDGASGAESPEEYEFWSWRSCGIACLRMILEYHGQTDLPSVGLARECEEIGGYVRNSDGVRGLIYAPFVEWIRRRFSLTTSYVSSQAAA
jgi:hypothetical protein